MHTQANAIMQMHAAAMQHIPARNSREKNTIFIDTSMNKVVNVNNLRYFNRNSFAKPNVIPTIELQFLFEPSFPGMILLFALCSTFWLRLGAQGVTICPSFLFIFYTQSQSSFRAVLRLRTFFIRQEELEIFVLFWVKCKSGRLCFLSQIEGITRLTQTRHGTPGLSLFSLSQSASHCLKPVKINQKILLLGNCSFHTGLKL